VVLALFDKDKWRKITLVALAVMYASEWSAIYVGLYLFPAIMLFFVTLETRKKWYNVLILISFVVMLNPLQIVAPNINPFLGNVSMILLWFSVLFVSGASGTFSLAFGKTRAIRENRLKDASGSALGTFKLAFSKR
jgi:hypothetical protein